MSYRSDPDRLERFAVWVLDQPSNVLPHEVAAALNDAAVRIRSLQERQPRPDVLKVAICECLIAINDDIDPPNREKWGPIIPPTAIDGIGNRIVGAVLASVNHPTGSTP